MNDFKSSNSSGELSIAKQFGKFRAQLSKSTDIPPTLPDIMVNYTFTKALYPIEVQGKSVSLKFPKVNGILTEYCQKCLSIYCTLAFFEMFNKQFSPTFIPLFTNEKLESAVSLYKMLYFTTDTSAVKIVLAYYLDNPFSWSGSFDLSSIETKLTSLRNSLKDIEEIYKKRLFNEVLPANSTDKDGKPLTPNVVNWFNEKKAGKVLTDEAVQFFIQRANYEMLLDIKVEFSKNQVRTNTFYADPITSDPRLRMSLEDSRWDEYDETIKKEVAFYNQKFRGTAGFVPLDWRLIKAMIWTEVMAGPKSNPTQWSQFPMQIGRFKADAGYSVISKGLDNSDFITSAEMRQEFQNNIVGKNNVRAGIAYLFTKAIDGKIDSREIIDNPQILSYTIQATDRKGLDDIAKRLQTTSANIIKNSNGLTKATVLHPGLELKYQQAHLEKFISGWIDWETAMRNYNSKTPDVKGDVKYVDKFSRAYQIIISRTP